MLTKTFFIILLSLNVYAQKNPSETSLFMSLLKSLIYGNRHYDYGIKTTVSLAQDAGYYAESHTITTEDDYYLAVHRVKSNDKIQTTNDNIDSKVVFLQHGLMGSSDNWVTTKEDESLAYQLADLGYDVWMGNFRGNIYSRNHTKLSIKDPTFWKFSYDEMAKYDLPSMIEYVLKKTKVNSLDYIGHSMGSAVFFASLSRGYMSPHLFKSMTALAPVSALSLRHVKSPLKYLVPIARQIQAVLRLVGDRGDVLSSQLFNSLWEPYRACSLASLCDNIQFVITGFDPSRAYKEMLPTILSHNPAGTSTQTLLHFAQGMTSGHFKSFDFGPIVNLQKYGQKIPPLYDVRKIEVPVRLVYAQNDWLVGSEDVEKLEELLPNLIEAEKVPDPEFSHLDFLWSKNTNELVYKKIIKYLETREVKPNKRNDERHFNRVPRKQNLFRDLVKYFVTTASSTGLWWPGKQTGMKV